MFLTTHVSTTLLLCQGVSNPFLAFFIGLISHYLLDIIPHGDDIKGKHSYLIKDLHLYKENKAELKRFQIVAPIDITMCFLLTSYLFATGQITNEPVIMWGILGAILPDAIMGINLLTDKRTIINKWNWLHLKAHTLISDIPFYWALTGQMIYNSLILYILYFSKHGI